MSDNVLQTAQSLVDAIRKAEGDVAKNIAAQAAAKEWGLIAAETDRAQKLETFRNKAQGLLNEWLRFTGTSSSDVSEKEDIPVEERTTWTLIGDKIRVETEGGNTKYSNIVPTNLFVSLAWDAYMHIVANGFVKTSHVLANKKEAIRQLSDYNSDSSIRLPVYVTFKVLVLEKLFDKIDSHKYGLAIGSDDDFKAFLKKIDVAVSHDEAVRRLRAVGEEDMADDLENWVNSTSSKGGWDGAVVGQDGELFKRHGAEMRENIWPYRY